MKFLQKRMLSFAYACKGLWTLTHTQPHFRFHLLAMVSVVAAGLYIDLERWEWICIVIAIAMVLAAEAINTSVEFVTDLVCSHHHPLAGHAKDVAAAAVLICAVGAAIIAFLIFGSRI